MTCQLLLLNWSWWLHFNHSTSVSINLLRRFLMILRKRCPKRRSLQRDWIIWYRLIAGKIICNSPLIIRFANTHRLSLKKRGDEFKRSLKSGENWFKLTPDYSLREQSSPPFFKGRGWLRTQWEVRGEFYNLDSNSSSFIIHFAKNQESVLPKLMLPQFFLKTC